MLYSPKDEDLSPIILKEVSLLLSAISRRTHLNVRSTSRTVQLLAHALQSYSDLKTTSSHILTTLIFATLEYDNYFVILGGDYTFSLSSAAHSVY